MKSKKNTVRIKSKLPHMKYHTYVALKTHLEQEKEKLHREFCIGANLTYEYKYDGSSPPKMEAGGKHGKARDAMWKTYCQWRKYYDDMLEQLHYAAQESNRTHPNLDIRAFWCV
jgi:hypothetical protein